jgi:cation diffusion facilitator CzcD-associated flavoprotein CzcO
MKQQLTAVIGAGPYGLAVAAHLRARRVPTVVFGKPMEFWQRMPAALYLKSSWSAASLSDPRGRYSLDRYVRSVEPHPGEPIPLGFFLRYARWFIAETGLEIDATYVESLNRSEGGFRLNLSDGRVLDVERVVVAVGIRPFAHIPAFAQGLPPEICTHTQDVADLSVFAGRRLAVVGSGQSALEYAALASEAGASVEVIARDRVVWINRSLYDRTGPAKRLFYPPSDVGPPGINWLVAFPLLMWHLPARWRTAMHRRAVRPAGAKWLRPRVVGRVRITDQAQISSVRHTERGIRIELGDGTFREVDHLLLGTGFQPNLDAISFVQPGIRRALKQLDGYPLLNKWFESSLPKLHFVGGVAGYNFGPLCNFMVGARAAARQVAERAANPA